MELNSTKKSIRFFNDYEVRAVWDEENSKWWFSATDNVRAVKFRAYTASLGIITRSEH